MCGTDETFSALQSGAKWPRHELKFKAKIKRSFFVQILTEKPNEARGKKGLYVFYLFRTSCVVLGLARFPSARLGLPRLGSVFHGSARLSSARLGSAMN